MKIPPLAKVENYSPPFEKGRLGGIFKWLNSYKDSKFGKPKWKSPIVVE
jgi:hypothetical protein